jgi:NhaP-type Na+/H+ or K+/H+ antiporter
LLAAGVVTAAVLLLVLVLLPNGNAFTTEEVLADMAKGVVFITEVLANGGCCCWLGVGAVVDEEEPNGVVIVVEDVPKTGG